MQIKSEQKVNKKVMTALFTDPKQNTLISKNVANINKFFELFQKIKQHRTLEKLCNHYTVDEKIKVFDGYVELIDEVEELMDKFEEYTKKVNLVKQTIKINKESYSWKEWQSAICKVALKGQNLTDTMEQKLKLTVKAFKLQVKIPIINWRRWLQNCTEQKYLQQRFCGCF